MMRSLLFSLSFLLILLSSCNDSPNPAYDSSVKNLPESDEILPNLPEKPPITTEAPKSSGTMTNQPVDEITPVTVDKKLIFEPKKLLGYVQEAIIPIYKDWVLFENGTYIIFDNIDTIPDVQKAAFQHLKTYTPKTVAETNWDFTISDLDQVEGWSVYGNGYGIYTFIHPTELSMGASPQQIGAYAKAKRALDEKKPKIIFISSKNGIQEIQ